MNVGVIGLGQMGRGMARSLLRAGHTVKVWNRTRSRAEELTAEAAQVAKTPADACTGDAVISCLADDAAVEAVVFEEGGIAAGLTPSCIHISMSTLSVDTVRRLGQVHEAANQRFIAAPVFGRPDAAASGKLLIVASGDIDAISQCRPILDALGQRTVVLGADPVAAPILKIVGNFLLLSAVESLAEALSLLRKSGVDARACLDLLTSTLFAAPVYKSYSEVMLERRYEPGFRLTLGLKDVGLALDAAASVSVPMPMASVVRDRLLSGIARGHRDLDVSALALISEEDSRLPV